MVISFKIEEKVKEAVQVLAEKENRTLSNYIATLIIKHLQDQGIDWRKEKKDKK